MNISINIPDELYQQAVTMAQKQQIPVDDLFVSAFVDQVAAWRRLRNRGLRGNREKYLAVLDAVPETAEENHATPLNPQK